MRKFLLIFSLIIIILIVASTATLYYLRSKVEKTLGEAQSSQLIQEVSKLLDEKVDLADLAIKPFDRVVHTSGQREWEIHADEARIFQEKSEFILTNIKQFRFFQPTGEIFQLKAAKGSWNQKEGVVQLSGAIEAHYIVTEDSKEKVLVQVQSEDLQYDRAKQKLTTTSGVAVTWEGIKVKGNILNADIEDGMLHISGQTVTEITSFPSNMKSSVALTSPLIIKSDSVSYAKKDQRIDYDTNVEVTYDQYVLTCQKLILMLDKVNHLIKAERNVVVSSRNTQAITQKPKTESSILDSSGTMTIACDSLLFDYETRILTLAPRVVGKSGMDQLECNTLQLYMDKKANTVQGAIAEGEVQGVFTDSTVSCDKADWNHIDKRLVLTGSPKITRSDGYVQAPRIIAYPDQRLYKLSNGVKAELKPGNSKKNNGKKTGLLLTGSKAPVLITCEEASLDENNNRSELVGNVILTQENQKLFAPRIDLQGDSKSAMNKAIFSEGIKITYADVILVADKGLFLLSENKLTVEGKCTLWQGDNYTKSDRMNFLGNDEIMIAAGNVESYIAGITSETRKAVVPGEPASATEGVRKEIQVWSDQLKYEQGVQLITYSGRVRAKYEDVALVADTAKIVLDPMTSALQKLTATGSVDVTMGDIKAQGDELHFIATERVLTLIGQAPNYCKIYKNDRGTQGQRIKILLNEKRYIVEGGTSVLMPPGPQEKANEKQGPKDKSTR